MEKTEKTDISCDRKKVLIVDDHPLVCDAMSRAIALESDLEVCAVAEDAAGAMEAIDAHAPDIVVVDISLGRTSGIELLSDIKSRHPGLPSLVLSMHEESTHAGRALRAGAKGYIMKSRSVEEILQAIRHVLAGQTWVSKEIMADVLQGRLEDRESPRNIRKLLSKRELQVFKMMGKGISSEEIAQELFICKRTVESHREHIKNKLGLKDVFSLHQTAFEWVRNELSS